MCGRPKEQQAVPLPTPQYHLKITKVNKVTINQKGKKNEITFRNHN
jgi:hypothetical protein